MRNQFEVPCLTRTYADTLLALGLAETLERLGGGEVTIRFGGDRYTLEAENAVEDMTGRAYIPLFDTIRAPKEPDEGQTRNYEALKAHRERFFKLPREMRLPQNLPEGYAPPSPDYSLMSSLVDLLKPMAQSSYSKTAKTLRRGNFGLYLEAALRAFSEFSSEPLDGVEWLKQKAGKDKIELFTSAVMVFNPMSGKGMNSDKPNSIGMGSLDSPIIFEMLKYSGWWVGAHAATPKKTKDLKVLVVSPKEIQNDVLRRVMQQFRTNFYSAGSVQIDVLAALKLTEVLLKSHESQEVFFDNPRQVIDGFHTAYFQNLGSAKGVSNLSFIGLPGWIAVADEEDCREWLKVVDEHRRVLSRLDESRSEAHGLLEHYRDFLSLGLLEHFLEFLVDYGAYAIQQLDRSKTQFDRPTWFYTGNLRRVLMGFDDGQGKPLKPILDNQGFQNIAAAIRRSTRNALYAKISKAPKRSDEYKYEVRYGLAQELKRKAIYPEEFAAALGEFVTEYMAENYRAAEREKRQRPAVTTADLEQVISLMDTHNPTTVAMLLIAYGYAKDTESKEQDSEPTLDDPDINGNSDSEGDEQA